MTNREIWVWGDLRTERHWKESLKVLAKALDLARSAQATVAMLVLGGADHQPTGSENIDLSACVDLEYAAQKAAAVGADTVYGLTHTELAVPRTDLFATVLAGFVQQRNPWLVLFPLNDFAREIAAVGAQRCQAGLIADCTELILKDNRFVGGCPAWGGQVMAEITLAEGWQTAFVTVQPHGTAEPIEQTAKPGRIEMITPEQVTVSQRLLLTHRRLESEESRRLEEAPVVVVGGAGLGNARGFAMVRELAAALGGEVGATRPPILNHWVDENCLIGQTGKSVHPRLLLAAGVSGAVQFTAGIMEAETIVAINRDPDAPIFQVADIGLVADAGAVMPLLIQRAKRAAMRQLADAACSLRSEDATLAAGFGALVRQLRQAREWNVEELAQSTGQTPEFINQVETDQVAPPVGFILEMARAMQIDPGTFLGREERSLIRDRRAEAFHRRTKEYSYTTLTPSAEASHLRGFLVTIEPHQSHKPVAYKHEGEEFIYVLEGELELTLGNKASKLKPGESTHFNSDTPHKLKSISNQPTRCLVVLYTI